MGATCAHGFLSFLCIISIVHSYVPNSKAALQEAVSDWQFNEINARKVYGPIDTWDTSRIKDMSALFMFSNTNVNVFNSPIGAWSTGEVKNMEQMFAEATSFNQPIAGWNTARVQAMGKMFTSSGFNQPIGKWNTGEVLDMGDMFRGATVFNQPVGSWNTAKVTTLEGTFCDAHNFNQPIETWNVANVGKMGALFSAAHRFNQPLSLWNTARVREMVGMFSDSGFDQDIQIWNTGNVIGMERMFHSADFNKPIGDWNTGNVVSMAQMFDGANTFDQDIGRWNTANVNTMTMMFSKAFKFDQVISGWNTAKVINMSWMFNGARAFNQRIGSWNVNHVIDMVGMFQLAARFDQPLVAWDVSQVLDMSSMFHTASRFNQPITSWQTARVTTMAMMFQSAKKFNQPISTWDVRNVRNLCKMFKLATEFNQPLGQWSTVRVSNMQSTFREAASFNQPFGAAWRTDEVTNMNGMFKSAGQFNQPIGSWQTARVTTMSRMLKGARRFNQPIAAWNTARVTDMYGMFCEATQFNQPMPAWQVARVADMKKMFSDAIKFNQPIGTWNTCHVSNMSSMFRNASGFNQPIGTWNTARVVNMWSMFSDASKFNQNLAGWSTSKIPSMFGMFSGAIEFNQPIDTWNTARVHTLTSMFKRAEAFNQPVATWNTARVTSMEALFLKARVFNQPLGSWNIASVVDMTSIFGEATSFCQDISDWSASPAYPDVITSLSQPAWPVCIHNTHMPTTTLSNSISMMTTLTTSSLSTTIGAEAAHGYLIVRVSNASRFVNEPNVTLVMQVALAQAFCVNVSWVQGVTITLVPDRRALRSTPIGGSGEYFPNRQLSPRPSPDVTAFPGKGVKIEFRIVIPPSGKSMVAVDVVVDQINAVDLVEASAVIDRVLKSGLLGQPYDAVVTQKIVLNKLQSAPLPAPSPTPDSTALVVVLTCTFSLIGFCVLLLILLRTKQRTYAGPSRCQTAHSQLTLVTPEFGSSRLLSPPCAITLDMRLALQSQIPGLLDSRGVIKPEVFICYSLGKRPSDFEDTGPGLFYAAAVSSALSDHAIQSLGSLAVQAQLGRSLDVLTDKDTPIISFVVVETQALFHCEHCLQEIYMALQNKIPILRLRFEDDLPIDTSWWGEINVESGGVCSWIAMREFVKVRFSYVEPVPPRPLTILTLPSFLEDFALDLKSKLFLLSSPLVAESGQRDADQQEMMGGSPEISEPGGVEGCAERSVRSTLAKPSKTSLAMSVPVNFLTCACTKDDEDDSNPDPRVTPSVTDSGLPRKKTVQRPKTHQRRTAHVVNRQHIDGESLEATDVKNAQMARSATWQQDQPAPWTHSVHRVQATKKAQSKTTVHEINKQPSLESDSATSSVHATMIGLRSIDSKQDGRETRDLIAHTKSQTHSGRKSGRGAVKMRQRSLVAAQATNFGKPFQPTKSIRAITIGQRVTNDAAIGPIDADVSTTSQKHAGRRLRKTRITNNKVVIPELANNDDLLISGALNGSPEDTAVVSVDAIGQVSQFAARVSGGTAQESQPVARTKSKPSPKRAGRSKSKPRQPSQTGRQSA